MAKNNRKKSKKKLFIFGGIGLLVIVLIIIALVGGGKEDIILVQTEEVEKRDITQTVTATGTINPEFKVVVITPEVTGEIISLPVEEGDFVKKGDLLIKIKGDQYQAQRERLEANLKSSEASLRIRQAELNRVTLEYNRMKELHSKGLASDSELETAESNYLTSKASYDGAEANVLQSKAQLREVLETLYKTTLYSPMDTIKC